MKKFKLTNTSILKLPFAAKGKQVDYLDSEVKGFGVRVSATTKRYFVRSLIGRRRVRVMLNSASLVSAEEARSEAKIKLGLMESGIDPNEEKRAKQREEEARLLDPTIKDLVQEYIEKYAKVKKKTWAEDRRCLEKDIIPRWGRKKAKDIRRRDVKLLLQGIVDRGSPIQANNTLEKIRKMFNFAIDEEIIEFTPCYMVKMPSTRKHKDRVLSEDEITTFWDGLDMATMSDEIKRALKLILVTGQRPGEVIGMHSSEIDGQWWTIPVERAKNGKANRVYLTELALELIGTKQGFIFETPTGGKSIGVNAVSCAVRRNFIRPDDEQSEHSINKTIMQAWTPHDLRRTAATEISKLGFADEIIDAVLNHRKRGVIAIYNRNKYDSEKRLALEAWARKLHGIIIGTETAKVIPLRRKAL
jgi:integrase